MCIYCYDVPVRVCYGPWRTAAANINVFPGAGFDSIWEKDSAANNFRSILNKGYDVNVTGAQVLTNTFLPLLLASVNPQLIFVTSAASTLAGSVDNWLPSWQPPPPSGWPKTGFWSAGFGYKCAKTALNMLMLTWHWILRDQGVKTWCVSPGFLATNLARDPEFMKQHGAKDASLGGTLIRQVVEGERDADVGKVVMRDGEVQPW
jgi:NAD(P)-dependent dehydrogenase (short-subunit alcohol dehydrogenase family)